MDSTNRSFTARLREVERSLQIATGALFLALLSFLANTWGDIADRGHLLTAILRPIASCALAFSLAILATYTRVATIRLNTPIIVAWSICLLLSAGMFVYSGWRLIDGLVDAVDTEFDNHRRQMSEALTREELIGLVDAADAKLVSHSRWMRESLARLEGMMLDIERRLGEQGEPSRAP